MKSILLASLFFSSFSALCAPELVLKKPLSQSRTISLTVFGQHASKTTPYYTRLFRQGNLENSYFSPDSPIFELQRFIPCSLADIKYESCKSFTPEREFEELDQKTVSLLNKCALRMLEFDTLDLNIGPEGDRITEIQLPASCGSLLTELR